MTLSPLSKLQSLSPLATWKGTTQVELVTEHRKRSLFYKTSLFLLHSVLTVTPK